MYMKREFKIGDKVFDYRFGEGTVKQDNLCNSLYPIKVSFEGLPVVYTKEGKFENWDKRPCLFHLDSLPENSQERVVLVSSDGVVWFKRVFIKKTSKGWICWEDAQTLEESLEVLTEEQLVHAHHSKRYFRRKRCWSTKPFN